jgi:hypothetical protein
MNETFVPEVIEIKFDGEEYISSEDLNISNKDNYGVGCYDAEFPTDDLTQYNNYNAQNFPGVVTRKRKFKEIVKVSVRGRQPEEIKKEPLTKEQKRYYTKVVKNWMLRNKYKKFLVSGFTHEISKHFDGSPERKQYECGLPKKTWLQKAKYWVGYKLYVYHQKKNKWVFAPASSEETLAIQYVYERKIMSSKEPTKKLFTEKDIQGFAN